MSAGALRGSNCIQAVVHLSNALLHQGYVDFPWQDLNALVQFMGVEGFFTGNRRPRNVDACIDQFFLMAGISPAAIAGLKKTGNLRKGINMFSRRGTKSMSMNPHSFPQPNLIANCMSLLLTEFDTDTLAR